jgi:CBS domain-containing protein
MNVKIAQVMAPKVVTLQRHHTVDHARGVMRRNGVHALPVVEPDASVAGIVTSHDLASDLKGATPISKVMTRDVYTIPQYNDVHHAARLMRNHRIHHVVVTHEKEVVGIVSSFDLLKLVEEHRFVMKPGPTPPKKVSQRQ